MKVDILLRWDADVHIAAKDGRQPLHVAAENGCVNCVSMLLDRGASTRRIDLSGYTPLHHVAYARDGCTEVATMLLSHDVEVDAESVDEFTPLQLAVECGKYELALKLLEHGADIKHRGRDNGRSVIMTAVICDRPRILRVLIGKGARMDLPDSDERNVLHFAALCGSVETMNVLTDANIRGVDVNGCDIDGRTPLECFEDLRTVFYNGIADLDMERPHFERLLASVQETWHDCEE